MDEASFDAFYAGSVRRLVSQLYVMTGDLGEAQDCVQEAFVKAWQHRRQLTDQGNPEAWVRTTAWRLAISRWRRATATLRAYGRHGVTLEAPTPERLDPDLADALRTLPPEQRRAVVLFYLCDLSIAAISSEAGIKPGTVRVQLSRGRAALAACTRRAGPTHRPPRHRYGGTLCLNDTDYNDDGVDRRIRHSLGAFGVDAAQGASPSTGADIRRRAGRRRQVLAAGTLSIALIAGGGAIVATDVLDRPGAGTDVVPADSSSPTPPATTEPAPQPTVSSAEPSTPVSSPPVSPPTSVPSSAPTTSTPPPLDGPPTEIPVGFTLPHEGELSDDPDTTDWETVEGLTTPWDMSVCDVDRFAGDDARTDFRKVSQSGPEYYDGHSLAVYGDAETAVGVMAAMRAAIESCVDQPSVEGQTISWSLRAVDVGGEAFVAVSAVQDAEGNPVIGGGHYAVTRLGAAIYLVAAGGESFPTVDDETSGLLAQRLEDFVPQLCVFTVAGC